MKKILILLLVAAIFTFPSIYALEEAYIFTEIPDTVTGENFGRHVTAEGDLVNAKDGDGNKDYRVFVDQSTDSTDYRTEARRRQTKLFNDRGQEDPDGEVIDVSERAPDYKSAHIQFHDDGSVTVTDGDGTNPENLGKGYTNTDLKESTDSHLDRDHDGLNDYYEYTTSHTSIHNSDTDGDGVTDGIEIEAGTDPNDPTDFPSIVPEFSTVGIVLAIMIIAAIGIIILRKKK